MTAYWCINGIRVQPNWTVKRPLALQENSECRVRRRMSA